MYLDQGFSTFTFGVLLKVFFPFDVTPNTLKYTSILFSLQLNQISLYHRLRTADLHYLISKNILQIINLSFNGPIEENTK